MIARLLGRRIRWTQVAGIAIVSGLLAAACAEPATVDPELVPDATVDAPSDAKGDADPDTSDGAGGNAGSGGSGGGGRGGAAGVGGTGGSPEAGDGRSEAGDAPAEDIASDGVADAPPSDTSVDSGAPQDGGGSDATRDPISEPPTDSGRGDVVVDASSDRSG